MEDTSENEASHRRGRTFDSKEVFDLLTLIEKYKRYVLNKSNTSSANKAKDAAWAIIVRKYNSLGHDRNYETLKTKFENLKRQVNKTGLHIDLDPTDREVNNRMSALIIGAEKHCNIELPEDSADEIDEEELNNENAQRNEESDPVSDDNDNNDKSSRVRSQNFSPEESKLLVQCVKQEKPFVFCKDITGKAIEMKNQAWSRITDSYNRLSPKKRSTKSLRMKFTSMKKMARKLTTKDLVNSFNKKQGKHEKFNNSFEDIKKEPRLEERMSEDSSDQFSEDEPDFPIDTFVAAPNPDPDPLSSVLNADSGIGSSSMGCWNWNQSENKDVVKLKMDLLNYQMETAKLERKRLEETMLDEARERESRELERALRVRAARLEAVWAASRLPPAHPALAFRPHEVRAQYHLT